MPILAPNKNDYPIILANQKPRKILVSTVADIKETEINNINNDEKNLRISFKKKVRQFIISNGDTSIERDSWMDEDPSSPIIIDKFLEPETTHIEVIVDGQELIGFEEKIAPSNPADALLWLCGFHNNTKYIYMADAAHEANRLFLRDHLAILRQFKSESFMINFYIPKNNSCIIPISYWLSESVDIKDLKIVLEDFPCYYKTY